MDGERSELRALERPNEVAYWSRLTATPDGSIWAVGLGPSDRGIVGRYSADATTPELAAFDGPIDVDTNIVAVAGGGVAVFPSDGSAWLSEGDARDALEFEPVETTEPPLIIREGSEGAARGIELPHLGRLSITGGEEEGFTSRLSEPDGTETVRRVIDARGTVREVTALRALRSGRAVAVLLRQADAPDAVVLTPDFGQSWLADAEQ